MTSVFCCHVLLDLNIYMCRRILVIPQVFSATRMCLLLSLERSIPIRRLLLGREGRHWVLALAFKGMLG